MDYSFLNCGDGALDIKRTCQPCSSAEAAGVRGVMFIKAEYADTARLGTTNELGLKLFDKTKIKSEDFWLAGLKSGDVVQIPSVRGSFDGGAPNMGAGTGNVEEVVLSTTFTLPFKDGSLTEENANWWRMIAKSNGKYYVAWVTESKLFISDAAVSVAIKTPIAESLKENVYFETEIKWTQTIDPLVPFFDITKELQSFFVNCIDLESIVAGGK